MSTNFTTTDLLKTTLLIVSESLRPRNPLRVQVQNDGSVRRRYWSHANRFHLLELLERQNQPHHSYRPLLWSLQVGKAHNQSNRFHLSLSKARL